MGFAGGFGSTVSTAIRATNSGTGAKTPGSSTGCGGGNAGLTSFSGGLAVTTSSMKKKIEASLEETDRIAKVVEPPKAVGSVDMNVAGLDTNTRRVTPSSPNPFSAGAVTQPIHGKPVSFTQNSSPVAASPQAPQHAPSVDPRRSGNSGASTNPFDP